MNELVEKVRELASGQKILESPMESASQDIYEHTRLVEALSGNTSVRTFISEIIEEYWETRDRIEDAKDERRSEQREDELSQTHVTELEVIPLDSFVGFQKKIIHFKDHLLYAATSIYREPYEKPRKGLLLRLHDDFSPVNFAGNVEDVAPGIDIHYYRDEFSFSLWGCPSCSIKYLDSKNGKYIQLGKGDLGSLSTIAFLAISFDRVEPFYEALIEFVQRIMPLDLSDVQLAGYDEIIQKCENVINYDNPLTMKRHLLLAGPPGCGKSMIMKQVAKNHPEYVRFNLSQTKNWLNWINLFAKVLQKCDKKVLLIIDEVDELGLSRDKDGETVYELLRLMDGTENTRNMILMASTNRLSDLDPALLRAGRFGPVLHVDLPNDEQKRDILDFYCMRYNCEIDTEKIIGSVNGVFSGADIRIAIEDCLIQRIPITTENVQRHLMNYTCSQEEDVY